MGFKTVVVVVMLFNIANCYPQAVSVGKGGAVSASFGGYHASAGLGGLAGGGGALGGLFASAGLPDGTGAAAGLGGETAGGAAGGAYAGAGVAGGPKASAGLGGATLGGEGGLHAEAGAPGADVGVAKPGGVYVTKTKSVSAGVQGNINVAQRPTTIFDDIFNIPTSVLQAVNQFLNNKAASGRGGIRKTARINFRANGGASGGATGGAAAGGAYGGVTGVSSGASAGGISVGDAGGSVSPPETYVITKTKSRNVAKTGAKLDANFYLNARAGCDGADGCVVVKEKPVVASSGSSSAASSVSASGNVGAVKNYDGAFNVDSALGTQE